MKQRDSHKVKRTLRHRRARRGTVGTSQRPRLHVFKSNKYIYASIIDDAKGVVLLSLSDAKSTDKKALKVERAHSIGESLGKAAQEKGIRRVVFDRGGYRFHGRVKAIAEGARKAGLVF